MDARHMQYSRRASSHTHRVQPVGFGQASLRPIELGEPTTAALYRQATLLQPLKQGPPRRVDRCDIFEWGFGLSLDLLQTLQVLRQRMTVSALEVGFLPCSSRVFRRKRREN